VAIAAVSECWDAVPHHAVRDAYVTALRDFAQVDVIVAPTGRADSAQLLRRLDGLLLTGSVSNVHPSAYGQPAVAGEPYDHARDAFALAAVQVALALALPILGICRGLHELVVALGGSLRTLPPPSGHTEDETLPRDHQYLPSHEVSVTAGGLLERITGPGPLNVNSLHRQVVDELGPRLRCEGRAPDDVIEAVSLGDDGAFVLGVQWHPEWHAASDPVGRAIFAAFGEAAAR
jgi:putative glutamine amidotransferase